MPKLHKIFCLTLLVALLAACAPATPAATSTPTGPTATSTTPPTPTLTPYPTSTNVPTPVADTLFVDATQDLGPISPYVYGSNYGPWASMPPEMLPTAFASHITVVRWPGGEWGDRNDVQSYQIDTFMGIMKKMGATPTISVRLRDSNPQVAAGLVQYMKDSGHNVQYWSIGNEPNLFAGSMGKPYDTEQLNREWRAIAVAMKAVDPNLKLIGPELSQFTGDAASNPKDSKGLDFMTEFLKVNGDMIDIVTIHRYPFPRGSTGSPATFDEMRANPVEWEKTIPYLRGLIRENTGREIPIAVTEISSYYSGIVGGDTSPDSFYNAIWYADVLGRLIRQRVVMVNMWLLANRQGGHGLIAGLDIRPTYYVFQMYSHFGNQLVYAASGVPNVSVYAAKREDGTLTLLVVNLADTEQTVPLQVQGATLSKANTWLFDATHKAEAVGETDLSGGKVTLPPQSISVFELPK